eukprot:56504-Eustigmatos_ZCMA.PRE.1
MRKQSPRSRDSEGTAATDGDRGVVGHDIHKQLRHVRHVGCTAGVDHPDVRLALTVSHGCPLNGRARHVRPVVIIGELRRLHDVGRLARYAGQLARCRGLDLCAATPRSPAFATASMSSLIALRSSLVALLSLVANLLLAITLVVVRLATVVALALGLLEHVLGMQRAVGLVGLGPPAATCRTPLVAR